MNKLPAPVASLAPAPLPRALPHAYNAQGPNGAIVEVLDGETRRAFNQRHLRYTADIEFDRPPRGQQGFAATGSASAHDTAPTPNGPSAAFLAQLIGQAVLQTEDGSKGLGDSGPAHGAYRQAGGEPALQTDSGLQFSFTV